MSVIVSPLTATITSLGRALPLAPEPPDALYRHRAPVLLRQLLRHGIAGDADGGPALHPPVGDEGIHHRLDRGGGMAKPRPSTVLS